MIPSVPQSRYFRATYRAYVLMFFVYLLAPLLVVAVFAFNDSMFPSLPWGGWTLDWFFSDTEPKLGILYDGELMDSIGISATVALFTTLGSLLLATCNAFLFERKRFPGKDLLYLLMLTPLVIPGVILGVSILLMSSGIANDLESLTGYDIESLRPGLPLVVTGQFAFITTICTLIVSARLRKFNPSLEEAALNLGANRLQAAVTITVPYLSPALIGAGVVSFLMSFENFNTTLMLVGSEAPLTIAMFDRLREGSTPALNAVSLLLMMGSAVLVLISVVVQRDPT
ncbi:MAG: ABC transporter permease [Gammaproteobacteria bacterium]|nr:ABC transporter permease [Gammaproteobacteria bacterium]